MISSTKSPFKFVLLISLLFSLIAHPSFLITAAAGPHQSKSHRHDRRVKRSSGRAARRSERLSAKGIRVGSRRQRVAEMLRRRRAEAARLAAIARQRALDNAMRLEVQSMIVRDNVVGEDPEVRRIAVNALGNHAGTVVVMDPKTGRVYSIVNQEWALRRGFKPCSTIKLVTGVAGLNEKVIDPIDISNASSTYRINLTDALAYSNNAYFQQVGGRVGFDKMISYARGFGLGENTGINAPNEFQGQVPALKSGFAVNHMSSHGDDFKVTAVQLATLVSAMANGGKLLTPQVPRNAQDEAKFRPRVRRVLNINLDSLRYMIPGMVGSVNYGSGRRAHDPQETVAGKTGTCVEQGTWVGLFASYAPLVDPRLAVVVIARGSDAHSHFPAAVAGKIYRDLNGRFGTPTNLQVAGTLDARPGLSNRADMDPKAALNEEERDEATAVAQERGEATYDSTMNGGGSPKPAKITGTTATTLTSERLWDNTPKPTNNTVRRVLLPIPSRTKEAAKPLTTSGAAPRPGPQVPTRPRRVDGPQQ